MLFLFTKKAIMPGPKMRPRPKDFNEELVRRSPTFRKWAELPKGERLRYACRDFVKGHGDDEERLMRRIMIARRNNVRDHQALILARQMQSSSTSPTAAATSQATSPETVTTASAESQQQQQQQQEPPLIRRRTRRPTIHMSDEDIRKEFNEAPNNGNE